MDFKELTEYCQALALASKLSPDEAAVWRYMCRTYSRKFSTPLAQVIEMDPEHVILNVYEDQMDELDTEENLEKFLDIVYGLEDPEYEAQKRSELDEFISKAEAEEQERVKKKKPIHPALRFESEVSTKNTSENEEVLPPNTPQGGSINLSYLAKEETEGGFEE
jgi:hypothetical protein